VLYNLPKSQLFFVCFRRGKRLRGKSEKGKVLNCSLKANYRSMKNSSKDFYDIVRDLFWKRKIDTCTVNYGDFIKGTSTNCYREFFIRN
jgi:hypothetical protein